MDKCMEAVFLAELTGDDLAAAMQLTALCESLSLEPVRDQGYWKDKIYFMLWYKEDYVCYIAVKDPDEPQHRWTVWSDDIDDAYLTSQTADESIRLLAWDKVDLCGHCGSCGGGKSKMIFGKTFDAVCGCTFRLDDPQTKELSLIEFMILAKMKQIDLQNKSE